MCIRDRGAVGRVEVEPAYGDAAILGCPQPGGDVGVVVEASDDDLVPGLPRLGDGPADAKRCLLYTSRCV